MTEKTIKDLVESLSKRENQVLCMIASGMSRDEVSESLDISATTVGVHLGKAYKKLGVNDEWAAVNIYNNANSLYAISQDLVKDIESGMTRMDASKKHGVSPGTITKWLKLSHPELVRKRGIIDENEVKLIDENGDEVSLLIRFGISLEEISDRYGVEVKSVYRWACNNNIKIDRRNKRKYNETMCMDCGCVLGKMSENQLQIHKTQCEAMPSSDELAYEFSTNGSKTVDDLARKYKVKRRIVSGVLRKGGITPADQERRDCLVNIINILGYSSIDEIVMCSRCEITTVDIDDKLPRGWNMGVHLRRKVKDEVVCNACFEEIQREVQSLTGVRLHSLQA